MGCVHSQQALSSSGPSRQNSPHPVPIVTFPDSTESIQRHIPLFEPYYLPHFESVGLHLPDIVNHHRRPVVEEEIRRARPCRIRRPLATSWYSYDERGYAVRTGIDPTGNGVPRSVQTFRWGSDGRLLGVLSDQGGRDGVDSPADGHIDVKLNLHYDQYGRLRRAESDDFGTRTFEYSRHRVAVLQNGTIQERHRYHSDRRGIVTELLDASGEVTVRYTRMLDNAGRLRYFVVDEDSNGTPEARRDYSYDGAGRLEGMIFDEDADGTAELKWSYTYGSNGALERIDIEEEGSQRRITYHREGGRIVRKTDDRSLSSNSDVILRTTYSYDCPSNPLATYRLKR